jgi:hypothetical protein
MPAPITKEHRIYLALWRKAYRDRDAAPLTIKCSTFRMAMHQRLGLYRVIRPYRIGELFDPELTAAVELLVPTISPKEAAEVTITFRPRKSLSELEKSIETLGLSEEDFLTETEKSLHQELETLSSDFSPPQRSTPFYTRD